MSIIIKGATSNNLAEVDSNNNLKVNLPTYLSGSGYSSAVAEVDDGSVLGEKTLRPLDSSQDYRLRTGYDKILWQDTFNHAVLNQSKYLPYNATQTITVGGGFLNMNAGSSVATGTYSIVRTYRSFSLFNTYPVYVDFKAKFSNQLQANNIIEFGLGYFQSGGPTSAMTDGIIFRAVGGQLNAVTINNGNETQSSNIFIPVANTVYHFLIVIGQDACEFWVDDVLVSTITTPISFGAPCQSNSLPLFIRNYNTNTVTSAIQLNIAQIGISNGDMDMTKDWGSTMVGNGQSSISQPDGSTVGQTANYSNSAAPASTTLSNTTFASTNLLGGQFQFAAVAGAETDYIIFGYLNPVGTSLLPGKNLIITGVRIDTFNTVAAVATTATVFQWGIGVGATSISLAQADQSGANPQRGVRRLPLGVQTMPVGTAIGALATPTIDVTFSSPLIVETGTFCHIFLKMPIGTATATEVFRGTVLVNGYFE